MNPSSTEKNETAAPGLPDDLSNGIERIAGDLRFPVSSKADLLTQLGGSSAPFRLRGKREVKAGLWVDILPAQLFPFVTKENFLEKLTELYESTQRRQMSTEEAVTKLVQDHSTTLEPLLDMARGLLRGSR